MAKATKEPLNTNVVVYRSIEEALKIMKTLGATFSEAYIRFRKRWR